MIIDNFINDQERKIRKRWMWLLAIQSCIGLIVALYFSILESESKFIRNLIGFYIFLYISYHCTYQKHGNRFLTLQLNMQNVCAVLLIVAGSFVLFFGKTYGSIGSGTIIDAALFLCVAFFCIWCSKVGYELRRINRQIRDRKLAACFAIWRGREESTATTRDYLLDLERSDNPFFSRDLKSLTKNQCEDKPEQLDEPAGSRLRGYWLWMAFILYGIYPALLSVYLGKTPSWFLVSAMGFSMMVAYICTWRAFGNRWLVAMFVTTPILIGSYEPIIIPFDPMVKLVVICVWLILSSQVFVVNRKLRARIIRAAYCGWQDLTKATDLNDLDQKYAEYKYLSGESGDLGRVIKEAYQTRRFVLASPFNSVMS